MLAANFTSCLRLLRAAGAGAMARDPKTTATMLCPTDKAVAAFASDMGLTLDGLLARPALADQIIAYHIAPLTRARASALKGGRANVSAAAAGAFSSYAVSGDPHYLLRFSKDAKTGGVVVTDAQGRAARVVDEDADAGRSVLHGVDRVLMSGEYFPTLQAFAAFYAKNFSALATALNTSAAAGGRFSGTLFAPVDAAFAAAGKALPKGEPQLKGVLRYAQLPGVHLYPYGFNTSTAYATLLPGHTLSVKYRE
ncbi:MAG: hypothetical protein J3K34DRAFT_430239 [Monoraphidium minutum]|nr:MAG: hypothetical protein J3K34DRAFT_430239 [Monoraphidium minutum]